MCSAVALAGGIAVHLARRPLSALHHRTPPALDAQVGYEAVVTSLDRLAVRVTGRLQAGSLPGYLGVILATVVLLPGTAALLGAAWPDTVPLYDSAMQVPLGVVVLVAAASLLRARRRFTAVLLVGVIGYGVGALFVVDGAPDLALAQFLVETLSLVAFVLVLRRLPAHFTRERPAWRVRVPKAVLATMGGGVVAALAVVLTGARRAPPAATDAFITLAPQGAGAANVVNAIVVDFRALDTIAEISVVFIAAAGVASLVLATRYDRRAGAVRHSGQGSPRHEEDVLR